MEHWLRFSWLFCGAWVGVGNAIFFRIRLSRAIRERAIQQAEVDQFTAGTIGWIGGPCVALWIVQFFFAHAVSPDFFTWDEPYATIGAAICIGVWIVSFAWIWFRGGDRKLARICTLAGYQPFLWRHPFAFRLGLVLVIAGGIVGLLIRHRMSSP